jgi:glycosyltransferase involved in cell wall biosynthesis
VTCFNKKKFIPKFVNLGLELLKAGFEVVIVDDGSTDGSTQLLEDFATNHPLVKFFPLVKNMGSANARNHGIHASNRQYLFFLDIDDTCDLVALRKSVLELANTECDLLIANLVALPKNSVFPMPVSVIETSEFQMTTLSSRILETMGYSRFIYSRKFITNSRFRFFPERFESNSQNFILDDAFWLILISAAPARVLVCSGDRIIYHYNVPASTPQAWQFYVNQLLIIPDLMLLFLSIFVKNDFVIKSTLIRNSFQWMFETLRPLNFSHLVNSGLFSNKTLFGLSNYCRLAKLGHFFLPKLYFVLTMIALKNSLRIRTRIGLAS